MDKSINFFFEVEPFTFQKRNLVRDWIILITSGYEVQTGAINFIFVDDKGLCKINRKYLKNNKLTDIITFSYSEDSSVISGDIFISITRVRENARIFKSTYTKELHRVMIHGVLHLLGLSDGTEEEKETMHKKENDCLALLRRMDKLPLKKKNS